MARFIVKKPEKEVISMRISFEALERLDGMAVQAGISRNELINQMILFAFEHMEDDNTD